MNIKLFRTHDELPGGSGNSSGTRECGLTKTIEDKRSNHRTEAASALVSPIRKKTSYFVKCFGRNAFQVRSFQIRFKLPPQTNVLRALVAALQVFLPKILLIFGQSPLD